MCYARSLLFLSETHDLITRPDGIPSSKNYEPFHDNFISHLILSNVLSNVFLYSFSCYY